MASELKQDPYRMPCLLEKWLQSSVGLLKQEVADALASGDVTLEGTGEVCTARDMLILPDQRVLLGGQRLPCPADVQRRTWALHKPRMMETSMVHVDVPAELLARMDRRSCLSAWLDELVTEPPLNTKRQAEACPGTKSSRLFPIGRLDKNTSGLLLVTNDGELSYALCTPGSSTKVYRAQTRKEPRRDLLDRMLRGVVLEDGPARALSCSVVGSRPVFYEGRQVANEWTVSVTMNCGRNRIVRRMCAAVGLPINHLERVQIGPLGLDKLGIPNPNDSVELSAQQIEQLWSSCGGKEKACERKRKALELMLGDDKPAAHSPDQKDSLS